MSEFLDYNFQPGFIGKHASALVQACKEIDRLALDLQRKRVASLVIVPDTPGYVRATVTYSDGTRDENRDNWTRELAWKWATQRADEATAGAA